MITERKLASAMGGKTARTCDGCLRKRARWFCPADDAFLCQACDASVHSANELASRHERVILETASSRACGSMNTEDSPLAWHQGFTRKARTPRHNKSMMMLQHVKDGEKILSPLLPLVPEIGCEEEGNIVADDETEDQFLYRVPVFDPFAAELCDVLTSEGTEIAIENAEGSSVIDDLPGFLPSEMDLAEFAADVENLLGRGLDDDSPDIKDLGLLYCKEEVNGSKFCSGDRLVLKIKNEEVEAITGCHFDQAFEMKRESLHSNFDYESPVAGDEEEKKKVAPVSETEMMVNSEYKKKMQRNNNISLRLNYEAVITAWASQGSPWTTGSRPELNPDDSWPECTGALTKNVHQQAHAYGSLLGREGDGAREARVMRYKEKRRSRLFSKKIRYQVRKLNAEKRPRMKGRFVKRTSFVGTSAFSYPNTN